MEGLVSRRVAARAGGWLLAWSVTLAVQWWSLWAAVLAVAEGGSRGHCIGTQTPQTCLSVWGPWSYAVYAPQGAFVVSLLAIAINQRPLVYRGTLALAVASLLTVWVAIAATNGWVIGQMPWYPHWFFNAN